jgi:hypothetical protein
MKSRWKRWAIVVAGLLATYALAGFWLVPVVVRQQAASYGKNELARQLSVGEVHFNPFTLRLVANNIALAEADGAPLLSVEALALQLRWRSLVRRAWTFGEVTVTAPRASLLVAPDGRFNLAALLDTLAQRPHDAATGVPRLTVERFALERGRVDLNDRRAGYSNQFSPIDFTLAEFSTLPDRNDSYTFTARSARGGTLRWKGRGSANPIRASGEIALENVSLPQLGAYLRSYTRATVAAGQLSATLPYAVSYEAGKLQASLVGARVALQDLGLSREGSTDSFATLTRLELSGIDVDLMRRAATVGEVRANGGKLNVKRDAKGQLDLANLMAAAAPRPEAAAPATAHSSATPAVTVNDWKLGVRQLVFDGVAINAVDETVDPPMVLAADQLRLQLQLAAAQAGADLQLTLSDAALTVSGITLASGTQTLFKLAQLGWTDGTLDLAARRIGVGRLFADSGQLQLARDRAGKLNVLALLPRFDASPAASPAPSASPWTAKIGVVELDKFGAEVIDQASGVKVHVTDLHARAEGAGSDLKRAVKFNAGFGLREGGQVSAQGSVVPAGGAMQADVKVTRLALVPLQPLLAQVLKLRLGGGTVSAKGRVSTGDGTGRSPRLRYSGDLDVAGLVLNEEDGQLFASWRNVGSPKFTAAVGPDLVNIPELRIEGADARLIIENDRSFNAARLLVKPAAARARAPASGAQPAAELFPVRIGLLRLQDAKLDFTDLSLRPQFGAKIHALNGIVSGLSSSRDSRSRVELDGAVDEFGSARVRGELNPFAPTNNTDLNVVFRNIDMVTASPYTMKFAGYRIAEGKISLDLQYKVRNRQLEGTNRIVIDKLLLGERVDSPDALKLPLEMAIALLKDSDGRIDLGLPVSGNLDDPQFSYGALISKAIGSVLTRIVTAPFRALASLFGGGSAAGEKLEVIDFDPGSDRLAPPESEKLRQVGQILAKRPQLRLSVPGPYSEAADGAALRTHALRVAVAERAGVKLAPGEEPGPVNPADEAVRAALRSMYAERFGAGELEKQQKPAEGESKTASAAALYGRLQERLEQSQPVAPDALARLGAQRSAAIVTALAAAGVDAQRVSAPAPGQVASDAGKAVPARLELQAAK